MAHADRDDACRRYQIKGRRCGVEESKFGVRVTLDADELEQRKQRWEEVVGESGPSTPVIQAGQPIAELLAPGFLERFDDTLLSWTIWDQCLLDLNEVVDGRKPASSVEELFTAFEPFLAPGVLKQIRRTLDALEDSVLGVETVFLPSLESVLENILLDLQERAHGLRRENIALSSSAGGQSRGQKNRQGGGRQGRNKAPDGQRQRRQGGGSRGRREQGGTGRNTQGSSRDDDEDEDSEINKLRSNRESSALGQVFKDVQHILVNLKEYTTPPKGGPGEMSIRRWSIAGRSREFAAHSEVASGHILYIPYATHGVYSLYHGTRVSNVHKFSAVGIQPFKADTEFSTTPAFYLTNDVSTAFSFPLHNRLSMNPDDTVAVFRFNFDVGILHGDAPAPSGEIFRVRWFELGHEDRTWAKFCEYNLYEERPKLQHEYDIVIGAMCFPDNAAKKVTPRMTVGLVQIALCSKAAWKWAGSCLDTIFIETRAAEELAGYEAQTKIEGRIDQEEWEKLVMKHPTLMQNMTLPYLKSIVSDFPSFSFVNDIDSN